MNQITVLIADDLPLLVDALADLLGGTARPDVALLDVRMPEGGGATFVLAFPRSAPLRRA